MTQMRKLKRSVARAKMKLAGLERLNRKRPAVGGGYMSFFSRNWRDYCKLQVNYERRIKERRKKRELMKRRKVADTGRSPITVTRGMPRWEP